MFQERIAGPPKQRREGLEHETDELGSDSQNSPCFALGHERNDQLDEISDAIANVFGIGLLEGLLGSLHELGVGWGWIEQNADRLAELRKVGCGKWLNRLGLDRKHLRQGKVL